MAYIAVNWNNYMNGLLGRSDRDLGNLSDVGERHFMGERNISNCITNVAQDIRIQVSPEGAMLLKKGSKVYFPNGIGKFESKVFGTDTVITYETAINDLVLVCNKRDLSIGITTLDKCTSGNETPIEGRAFWYDLGNNIIHNIKDTDEVCSFPIALFDCIGINRFKLKQVFNGFGFIGSTVYALPGVHGLVPNGRYDDGSLKSTKFVTKNVLTGNVFNSGHLYISTDGISKVTAFTGSTSSCYDEYFNQILYNGAKSDWCEVGYCNFSSSESKIASLNFKQPFHAVDYNEYQRSPHIINTYVKGNSGYNVYSNGYCEQWGTSNSLISQDGKLTISLLKKYKDIKYNIQITGKREKEAPGPYNGCLSTFGLSTTTFIIINSDIDRFYPMWHTYGYLAEGEY